MKKIEIIGASILDILVQGANENVFHTGSWPAQDIRMSIGGDAINEATVLSKLGVPVYLDTLLGEDETGKIIQNHCSHYGIHVREMKKQENIPTGINVVLVQENGERSFLTNPNGTLRKLQKEQIQLPFPEDTSILSFASIFVFPLLGNQEMSDLFRQAKAQGIILCADMTKCKCGEKTKDIREALSYLDYLMPNYEEAKMVTGKETLDEIAEEFLEAGVKNVVIKCGAKGCYVKNRMEAFQVPAIPNVPCVDTTGAGDSFTAGFLYGLWQNKTLKECAQLANICGALSVQQLGATEGIANSMQLEELKRYYQL